MCLFYSGCHHNLGCEIHPVIYDRNMYVRTHFLRVFYKVSFVFSKSSSKRMGKISNGIYYLWSLHSCSAEIKVSFMALTPAVCILF
jgi:hypothetical protein